MCYYPKKAINLTLAAYEEAASITMPAKSTAIKTVLIQLLFTEPSLPYILIVVEKSKVSITQCIYFVNKD